ncbi:cyanocobalamin reductase / alkylcobalamin dealkylase isoform X2 [Hemicordylus capensis]|uniref:cyanocobalamin reductase / alkylcobalamin dealkylase isoform X2 n=1 Tax=Hemicordylus capensis TaxID=884348 RepID=UPI002303D379|nr:cyanocobalamin reductase / alkylcobalamin dealkylase isoform X2 [Hemicordylus capensis]
MELRVVHLDKRIRDYLENLGFEIHPFKVGWYNAVLPPGFHLPYSDNTLAFVVLSVPAMFEKAFKPFLKSQLLKKICDPVDQCISHHLLLLGENLADQHMDVMCDYEMLPSRKPRFLAQTAAHVAGAAYYYQRKDVQQDPWGEKVRCKPEHAKPWGEFVCWRQKIYGVCIHPLYGGWFAIRALLLFPDIEAPNLLQNAPIDCVTTEKERIELLEKFNFHWRDWSYRDIIEVKEKYSEEQKTYFATPPTERLKLLNLQGLQKNAIL